MTGDASQTVSVAAVGSGKTSLSAFLSLPAPSQHLSTLALSPTPGTLGNRADSYVEVEMTLGVELGLFIMESDSEISCY